MVRSLSSFLLQIYSVLFKRYQQISYAVFGPTDIIIIIIIIILSFDIAPFPYKHDQRRITFHCQRIDVDIHIVN